MHRWVRATLAWWLASGGWQKVKWTLSHHQKEDLPKNIKSSEPVHYMEKPEMVLFACDTISKVLEVSLHEKLKYLG